MSDDDLQLSEPAVRNRELWDADAPNWIALAHLRAWRQPHPAWTFPLSAGSPRPRDAA